MRKTDARVETATEMMSVIRMIKMFGWENKIAERLEIKRTEELHWLRYSELVYLGNNLVTLCVSNSSCLVRAYCILQRHPYPSDGDHIRDFHTHHGRQTHPYVR